MKIRYASLVHALHETLQGGAGYGDAAEREAWQIGFRDAVETLGQELAKYNAYTDDGGSHGILWNAVSKLHLHDRDAAERAANGPQHDAAPVCGDRPCLHVPEHVTVAEDRQRNPSEYTTPSTSERPMAPGVQTVSVQVRQWKSH